MQPTFLLFSLGAANYKLLILGGSFRVTNRTRLFSEMLFNNELKNNHFKGKRTMNIFSVGVSLFNDKFFIDEGLSLKGTEGSSENLELRFLPTPAFSYKYYISVKKRK